MQCNNAPHATAIFYLVLANELTYLLTYFMEKSPF